ncbi:MAG: DUF2442 domain-containing protein [Verrucomicrobia bacterium]|nr:DUF2442 domain-containing protein [Verrucomicrobiota bacterium]
MNKRFHTVERIEFDGDVMRLAVDGSVYRLSVPAVSGRLARATAEQRGQFQVSPSGYGIHWPALDEDLSVDGLIRMAKDDFAPVDKNAALILNDKPNQ